MTVPFYRHDLGQPELDAIARVLAGPILTTGATVAEFERKFAARLGVPHCLGVTSCTGAAHMAFMALGIGPGDEVITTPQTFIATSTAIIEAGATPVFVDVEEATGNLDADRVEAAITPRTRAISPVHLYGQLCDMRALRAIADRHGLAIVEDAAHCVEGTRDGVGPGQLGDVACFSFYATKNLTSGEGGALVTRRDDLVERLRLLRLHGMTKSAADRAREGYEHWDMVSLGWKYNMDNIQAALLLPQLERLDAKWERRSALAARYQEQLAGIPGLALPRTLPGVKHAHHLFTAWVQGGRRDELIRGLQRRDIGAMVNYRAIHLLSYFQERFQHPRGAFPVAERIGDETVSMPFYPTMPEEQVDEVASAIREILS